MTQSETALMTKQLQEKRKQILERRMQYSSMTDIKKKDRARPSSSREKPKLQPVIATPQVSSEVIIQVYDEIRNVKRDFHCQRNLLLREMKYFASVFEEDPMCTHIDVHSDIQIFEWLMGYCLKLQIDLEPKTTVSILISSNFLQMKSLEDLCLRYMYKNIDEIIKVPIDFGCINDDLFTKYFEFEQIVCIV